VKKFNISEILIPTLVLFVICAVTTALLAGTNMITDERIEQLIQQEEDETKSVVLPGAVSFSEAGEIQPYFIGLAEDQTTVGYVFVTESAGYGGEIRVMTGISVGADTGEAQVTGVQILAQTETPGLGANAQEPAFTDQFKQPITAETGFALYGEQMGIDAMTGATITSRAVMDAVNQAVSGFYRIQEEATKE